MPIFYQTRSYTILVFFINVAVIVAYSTKGVFL